MKIKNKLKKILKAYPIQPKKIINNNNNNDNNNNNNYS